MYVHCILFEYVHVQMCVVWVYVYVYVVCVCVCVVCVCVCVVCVCVCVCWGVSLCVAHNCDSDSLQVGFLYLTGEFYTEISKQGKWEHIG